ncbi:MAG: ABC transporter ATP-binding protein [Firmicutes bacterium]|nr:ABC transporter ATP-binding protein [Bacillota bacterium]
MEPVISLNHVSKHFGHRIAVNEVSLDIASGQAVALLGPNGAGKTTSIAMMLGLLHPTTGEIRLLGRTPGHLASREKIGVVLQNVSVPERLKVRECINLVRGFYPNPRSLDDLLNLAGLATDSDMQAHLLSGGKMRRLQFALAMAGNPEVLFLDEPTVGMDVTSRRQFWDALRQYVGEGRTLILTTHDLQEADVMTDRVVVMHHGLVIADAPPERIKMEFGDRQISFVADDARLIHVVRQWAEVADVQTSGRQVTIVTSDSDAVLKRLIHDNWDIRDIRVGGTGLEDAFVRLTREEVSLA